MGKGTQCSEAWDAISRYIYTGLHGGPIMHGWTADDRNMIACCNDGTRYVIFHIRRIDYKVVRCPDVTDQIKDEFIQRVSHLDAVNHVLYYESGGFFEVEAEHDFDDTLLKEAVKDIVIIEQIDS